MISLQTFLKMGGYAIYVWPAYALAASIIFFNVIQTRKSERKILKKLEKYVTSVA